MKKLLFFAIYISLLLIYIYSIVFNFIPLSTKIILEGIGLLYSLKYIINNNYKFKKEFKDVIRIISFLLLWDIMICLLNSSFEFHLFKVMLPIIGSFFGAQLIYEFSKKEVSTEDKFMNFIVITIFLESVLAIFMKLTPSLYGFISKILYFDFGNTAVLDIYDSARFYGIGNAIYFGVLPSCSLGVITSVYLMKRSNSLLNTMAIVLMFIVISVTSFFIARTSLIIVGVSLTLLFVYMIKQSFFHSIKLVIMFFCIFAVAYSYIKGYVEANADLEKWAFDFIVNKDVETGSAGKVVSWWEESTFELKTLIIGDAQYTNPDGSYYKRVDIGYFREIYYGGLAALLLNLFLHAKILYYVYKRRRCKDILYLVCFLFLCYLVILAKGDASMVTFFILYLVYYSNGIFEKKIRKVYN